MSESDFELVTCTRVLGIAAAAAALCREVSNQRAVEITFHHECVPEGLSRNVAVCLYRVLQEAVQNAIKHSGTRKMDVTLRGGVDQIELIVRDFGAGFEVSTTEGCGLGLTSMKERARAVRGRLAIVSELHHGTTICATVPLVQDDPKTPSQSRCDVDHVHGPVRLGGERTSSRTHSRPITVKST